MKDESSILKRIMRSLLHLHSRYWQIVSSSSTKSFHVDFLEIFPFVKKMKLYNFFFFFLVGYVEEGPW